MLAGMIAAGIMAAKWWYDDYAAAQRGSPHPRAFPGAVPTNYGVLIVAMSGALILLALETGGESLLGLTGEQSHITVLFGFYTLIAAFVEELIFRGYLVVQNRGRYALVAGIIGASLVFSLLHPFLWEWSDNTLRFTPTPKGWFSTGAILAGSLWFYTVRFMASNPTRSLLPCIVAHLVKNLGVFAIKYAQGFVNAWW